LHDGDIGVYGGQADAGIGVRQCRRDVPTGKAVVLCLMPGQLRCAVNLGDLVFERRVTPPIFFQAPLT